MKQWLVRLGVVCALASSCPVFASEPAEAKEPRPQVLLEFVVLEIAGGSSRPLELRTGAVLSNAPNQLAGFSHAIKTGPGLESTVAALTRDAHVKILQRPRIQTSHDTPATLFVGEVAEKQPSGPPGSEPLMIGLTLDVTPFIHPDRLITLDLRMKQVTRDGIIRTKDGLVPITTAREAQAKLALRDRETILMSGLTAPARKTSAPSLRFPKDLPGASSTRSSRSTSCETLLLLRPTLVQK